MATRLPYHTEICYETLEQIAKGEAFLREQVVGNVRLRLHGDIARIEVDDSSMPAVLQKRHEISAYLKELGFLYITIDLEGFRSGSMDIHVLKDKERQRL